MDQFKTYVPSILYSWPLRSKNWVNWPFPQNFLIYNLQKWSCTCTTHDHYITKQIIFSLKFNKSQFIMLEVCVQLIHLWQATTPLASHHLWQHHQHLLTTTKWLVLYFCFFLCCNGILVDCDSSYSSICNIPMCHWKENVNNELYSRSILNSIFFKISIHLYTPHTTNWMGR